MADKKRYRVRVCREATESKDVIVEADSVEEANELAPEQAKASTHGWSLDDCNHMDVYLPDEASTEEVEDDEDTE